MASNTVLRTELIQVLPDGRAALVFEHGGLHYGPKWLHAFPAIDGTGQDTHDMFVVGPELPSTR
jgi:hypothetical protein